MIRKNKKILYKIIRFCVALVWLINGLFCKVLNMVPRHQQIVEHIFGETYGVMMTKLIGIAEIIMTVWIISGFKKKLNATAQIAIIITMNLLEFFLVPGLLLWGRFNLLYAIMLAAIIYYNEFVLYKESN